MTKYVKTKGNCGGCGREGLMVSAVPPRDQSAAPTGECDDCAVLRVSRRQKALNEASKATADQARQRWEEADDERLTALYEDGAPVQEIAEDLGRSYAAIRTRTRYLALTR